MIGLYLGIQATTDLRCFPYPIRDSKFLPHRHEHHLFFCSLRRVSVPDHLVGSDRL